MVKIIISCAMSDKIRNFYDTFEDDKIKCTFDKKVGIKHYYDCETEMAPDVAAKYLKGKLPDGAAIYFSVQPDGFFG